MKLKPLFSLLAVTAVALTACDSLPKIKVPFVGGSGAPTEADPSVPFDPHKPLTYGHTLKLAVYRGSLSPSRLYGGSVMVDHEGMVSFKKAGMVKLGGLTVYLATRAIEAGFERQRGDAIVRVQIESVEGNPIIVVTGAVHAPGAVSWTDGMTVMQALAQAGGHDGSNGHAVYITHQGMRHFHESADNSPLAAGDLVTFSSDL